MGLGVTSETGEGAISTDSFTLPLKPFLTLSLGTILGEVTGMCHKL